MPVGHRRVTRPTYFRRESPHVMSQLLQLIHRYLLRGTQNEHDGVTFGEHEQPVVGVRADATVFTLAAGPPMSCSW